MTASDPHLIQIETIARATVEALPAAFRRAAFEVVLQVTDWPPAEILQEMERDDPLDLTELYDGIPMTEKSVMDSPAGPDIVWLFAQPILAELNERADVSLEDLVTHVTIHEFAHHFGWSNAQIAAIDPWWE